MADQPGPGDLRVGGARREDQPRWQTAVEQFLQRPAAVSVGLVAEVGAVDGEQVENDVGGGQFEGRVDEPGGPRAQRTGRAPKSSPPVRQMTSSPSQHDVAVERVDGGGDVGEVCGERPLLARLHHHLGRADGCASADDEGAVS